MDFMYSNHLVGKVYYSVSHVKRGSKKKMLHGAIKISLYHFYNSRERLYHAGYKNKKNYENLYLVVQKVAIQIWLLLEID